MLNFIKNQNNTFVATVWQERNTVGNEYYIEFTHEQQQKVFTSTITDLSDFPYRYSKFTIDLPFEHVGDYEYRIYENQSKTNLLEVGKMHLSESQAEPKINQVNINDNIINE